MGDAVDVAIIGGTGIGERLAALPGDVIRVPTPAGLLSGRLVRTPVTTVLVVARHSVRHSIPPHAVNYEAIARGMKAFGIRTCFSTAAVGCLRPEWRPGRLAVCSDFLDFTGRNLTLFEHEVVHRDFTSPFGGGARAALLEAARAAGTDVETEAVYACANGPRYETPAEIRMYAKLGADLIGMTAASEAILLGEAGIEYGCLAIVTNLAAGLSSAPLDHQEVVEQMRISSDAALGILLRAAAIAGGAT